MRRLGADEAVANIRGHLRRIAAGRVAPAAASRRGEAHALAESKKTYLIVLDVAIGDEPSIGDEVAFDLPTRVLLGKMINESCGVA